MERSSQSLLRVMVVDDNPMIIDSLRRRFEREPTIEWAGSHTGIGDLVRAVRQASPNVILMDIDIPGADTFALVEELSRDQPACRVVMLSGHLNPMYLHKCMDCGAWGYLSKSDDGDSLVQGIHRVAEGEIALSKDVESLPWKVSGERAS